MPLTLGDDIESIASLFTSRAPSWIAFDLMNEPLDAKVTNDHDVTRAIGFEYDRFGRLPRKICPANVDGTDDVARREYAAKRRRVEKHVETIEATGSATLTLPPRRSTTRRLGSSASIRMRTSRFSAAREGSGLASTTARHQQGREPDRADRHGSRRPLARTRANVFVRRSRPRRHVDPCTGQAAGDLATAARSATTPVVGKR